MHALLDLFASFFVQLFIIVDPLVGVAVFLAITPDNTQGERRRMALRGCLAAALMVVFFLLVGPYLLAYFGVQTPAVRITGGVLLFVIAIEMLYGRPTGTGTSPREERLAEAKEDISITPLAIPLLAGPGAIATALIFSAHAHTPPAYVVLLLGTAAVFAVTYLFLLQAENLHKWLGTLGTTILTRLMGLILAFIAVQYVVDGIGTVLRP